LTGQQRNVSPNGGRKPQTKIKIEEIKSMKQDGDSHEIITSLNELVEGYQNEMFNKEKDIEQMKKLLK
jgi:hypothetical protein